MKERRLSVVIALALAVFLAACAPAPASPSSLNTQIPATVSSPTISLPPPSDIPQEAEALNERSTPESNEGTPAPELPRRELTSPGAEQGSDAMVSVIVLLDFEPLASYTGDVEGLAATSPAITGETRLDASSEASKAYLAYLESKIDDFEGALAEAIPEARIVYRYTVVLGGVSVLLPATEVGRLRQLPGVVAVHADKKRYPDRAPESPDVQGNVEGR